VPGVRPMAGRAVVPPFYRTRYDNSMYANSDSKYRREHAFVNGVVRSSSRNPQIRYEAGRVNGRPSQCMRGVNVPTYCVNGNR